VPEEQWCTNQCPQFYSANLNNGACDILQCASRYPNTTLSFDYCGVNCFHNGIAACSDDCPSGRYHAVTKVCEVSVDCSQYTYNTSSARRCGHYCVYDVETVLLLLLSPSPLLLLLAPPSPRKEI
jgi:hypothetical protein